MQEDCDHHQIKANLTKIKCVVYSKLAVMRPVTNLKFATGFLLFRLAHKLET